MRTFLVLSFIIFSTGCNTIGGVGQDIAAGGNAITKVSKTR